MKIWIVDINIRLSPSTILAIFYWTYCDIFSEFAFNFSWIASGRDGFLYVKLLQNFILIYYSSIVLLVYSKLVMI